MQGRVNSSRTSDEGHTLIDKAPLAAETLLEVY